MKLFKSILQYFGIIKTYRKCKHCPKVIATTCTLETFVCSDSCANREFSTK